MKIRDEIISRLRLRGELTIIENDNGEGCTVAIKAGSHVVTLQNKNADNLLSELDLITAAWPKLIKL